MGGIVSGLRPISTSQFNNNSSSLVVRGRVDGLLWTRSTSINISSAITRVKVAGQTWPTYTTSVISWGIVDDIKIPISTEFKTSDITWGIIGWSQETYVQDFPWSKKIQNLLLQNFHCRHNNYSRNNSWYYNTKILNFHHPLSWITLSLCPTLLSVVNGYR